VLGLFLGDVQSFSEEFDDLPLLLLGELEGINDVLQERIKFGLVHLEFAACTHNKFEELVLGDLTNLRFNEVSDGLDADTSFFSRGDSDMDILHGNGSDERLDRSNLCFLVTFAGDDFLDLCDDRSSVNELGEHDGLFGCFFVLGVDGLNGCFLGVDGLNGCGVDGLNGCGVDGLNGCWVDGLNGSLVLRVVLLTISIVVSFGVDLSLSVSNVGVKDGGRSGPGGVRRGRHDHGLVRRRLDADGGDGGDEECLEH